MSWDWQSCMMRNGQRQPANNRFLNLHKVAEKCVLPCELQVASIATHSCDSVFGARWPGERLSRVLVSHFLKYIPKCFMFVGNTVVFLSLVFHMFVFVIWKWNWFLFLYTVTLLTKSNCIKVIDRTTTREKNQENWVQINF
jgi:hypothetical protein